MKVAYITTYDPTDISVWSGAGAWIARSLEDQNCHLTPIAQIQEGRKLLHYTKKAYYKLFHSKDLYIERQPSVIDHYTRQIERKLEGIQADILFSPGSIPFTRLRSNKPKVFWTDACFQGLVDYYPEFSRLSEETMRYGNMHEQMAIDNCDLAIYSSKWAADQAVEHYGADPNNVAVVPFGANLDSNLSRNEVVDLINNRKHKCCELLFIGVDWKRKGGDLAYKVAKTLQKSGQDVRLTIIGCDVPKIVAKDEICNVIGFLDKRSPKGIRQLELHLGRSHFLIVPSLAECFGIVYCEANAFGVPSIGRQTGGVGDVIKNGVNGMVFKSDDTVEDYCTFIISHFQDKSKYRDLALRSFNEFENRLNWKVAGRAVKDLMLRLL